MTANNRPNNAGGEPELASQVMTGVATGDAAVGNAVSDVLGDLNPEAEAEAAAAAAAPAEPAAPEEPVIQDEPAEPAAPEEPVIQDEPVAPVEPVELDSPVPTDVLGEAVAEAVSDEGGDEQDEAPASIANDNKANKAWQKIKSEKRDLKQEVKTLKAQLEQSRENNSPDLDEVLELRKQIEGYETKLGQLDISSTKAFKERFEQPMSDVLGRAVSVLVRGGREADHAKKIMAQLVDPDTSFDQMQELLSDEPFAVQGSIVSMVTEYQDLASKRQQAVDHWQETRAALGEQAVRDQEIALLEDIENDTQLAVETAVKEGNWMFGASIDNEEWNQQVGERINAVKGIVRNAKGPELVKWIIEGVTAKPLRAMFMDAREQAIALKKELDSVVAASPTMGGKGPVRAPSSQRKPTEGAPRDPGAIIGDVFADEKSILR